MGEEESCIVTLLASIRLHSRGVTRNSYTIEICDRQCTLHAI